MKRGAVTPPGWTVPFPGFSQGFAVDVGGFRFVSIAGQIAVVDGVIVGQGDIGRQAEICYERIQTVVTEAGGSMGDLVALRTYLLDISGLAAVAEVRQRYLADPPPTSTAVEVTALALPDALIEIEAVAIVAVASGSSEATPAS